MFSVLRGYLNPGDEVICIEPFFDQYTASIVSLCTFLVASARLSAR